MTTFNWPTSLIPQNITVRPPRKTVGLTTSLSQFTQAVPAIRPPFGLTLEFDTLVGPDVLAWRAIVASLEGRANTVRIPLFDLWYRAKQIGGDPEDYFAEGIDYGTGDLADVLVTGVQGQRNISVDFGTYGEAIKAGLYFGVGDHPYIATAVSWAGTVATIRCSPTLRDDYDDQPLRLKPDMICRLTSDDGGELPLTNLRYGAPVLDLEEAFDEPLS
ncbi:hypothetical protein KRZ98_06200 [Sphingobium sp. AS12]|uniref:hypothetical protein n=1 Tax=Sphingobium sp. AS12 TaxID=2849495 RepID=UPI001C31BE04|nr:hypothetical protein [Sphingobium sp. AS12]MBV2147881.1 hypothetical protein [Sphingobium sp. AS12]